MMASVLSARRRTIGRAALVSVAVLAVLLRLLNISHGGAGFTDNVSGWRGGDLDDEFDALHFAQLPLSEYVNFPDGGNQILFYLIARAWILLTPEPSNAVLRLLPLLFSLASLPVLFAAVRSLSPTLFPRLAERAHLIALLATCYVAINPLHVKFATEFRSYSLSFLLMCCSTYVMSQSLRRISTGKSPLFQHWAIIGAIHGIALYLHLLTGIYFLSLLSVIALYGVANRTHPHRKLALGAVLSCALVALIGAPIIANTLSIGAEQIQWVPKLTVETAGLFLVQFLSGTGGPVRSIVETLLVGGLICSGYLLGFSTLRRRGGGALWGWMIPILLVVIPVAAGLVVSVFVTPIMLPRYFIYLLIPVAVVFALATLHLFDYAAVRRKGRNGRLLMLGGGYAIALLLALSGIDHP